MLSSQMHLLGTLTLSEWYHDEERVYSVLVTMTATECIAVTASNNREGLAKQSFPLKPLFVFMLIAVISWSLVFSGLKWYQMNSGSWPIQYRVCGGWARGRTHGYGGQRSTLNVFPCHSPPSFLRFFFSEPGAQQSARMASQWAWDLLVSAPSQPWAFKYFLLPPSFTLVLGVWTQDLMFVWRMLWRLSHCPGPTFLLSSLLC